MEPCRDQKAGAGSEWEGARHLLHLSSTFCMGTRANDWRRPVTLLSVASPLLPTVTGHFFFLLLLPSLLSGGAARWRVQRGAGARSRGGGLPLGPQGRG